MSGSFQHRLPGLWLLLQWGFGGTKDKRRLCRRFFRGERRILEVGCSVGNIAGVFGRRPGMQYLGVDIDARAIAYARRRFADRPQYRFRCISLSQVALHNRGSFDYVLFAGILHHVDDAEADRLLTCGANLLAASGTLVVVDPVQPQRSDNFFVRHFIRLDQGRHIRPQSSLDRLVAGVPGLTLRAREQCWVGASPLSWPRCTRFAVYAFTARKPASAPPEVSSSSLGVTW